MKELSPVSKEELQIALDVFSKEFEEFARRDFDNESDLQYSAVEIVAHRCIQAQIHILNKSFDEVSSILAETYHLIQECINKKYFSEDYVSGFRYVVQCLDIATTLELNKTTNETLTISKLKDDLNEVNRFKNLKLKDQVGVFAIKQYFLGNVRRNVHDMQIEVIKKIITMDPDCPEWRCCLYAVCKFKREYSEVKGPPSEEEKLAILAAYKLPNARHDPRILLGYVYCLAELLKSSWKSFPTPLTYGQQRFYSVSDVLEHIQDAVDDILASDPMSVRSNINVAKIYTSILPYKYRNISFGMVCIKRALLFHPNSSKANHRMGILRLSIDSPDRALPYLRRAFENDERNFYSLYDLLKLYIGNVDKYRSELDKLLEKVLNHDIYKSAPEKLAQLIFLKALYKFLDNDPPASVDLFVDAYLKSPTCKKMFQDIESDVSRYSWTDNKVATSKNIVSVLQNFLFKQCTHCSNPRRKEILKELYEASLVRKYNYSGSWTGGQQQQRGYSGGQWGSRGNTYTRGGFGSRGTYHNRENKYSQSEFNARGGFSSGRSSYNGNKQGGGGDGHYKQKDQKEKQKDGIFAFVKDQDHWTVLGISKNATKAEIKKAYYALALSFHPDKHMDASEKEKYQVQEKMKRINKAYESLTSK